LHCLQNSNVHNYSPPKVIYFLRKQHSVIYFCIMNTSISPLQNLPLKLRKPAEKSVLLYFAIEYFIKRSYSMGIKNGVHCILLQFYCISHCISIANLLQVYPRLGLYKLPKKRVLLYLIMSKFYNHFKITSLRNIGIEKFIINSLLFYYYSHYYSLLTCKAVSLYLSG
jgi:hypothetical protein